MTSPSVDIDALSFLIAFCPSCEETALTAVDLDADDQLVRVCLDCGTTLQNATSSGRWVDVETAVEMGYAVEGHQKAGGERGCRGGACGVRQPGDETA